MNLIIYNNTPLAKPISNIIYSYIDYSSENMTKKISENMIRVKYEKRGITIKETPVIDLVIKSISFGCVGFRMRKLTNKIIDYYDLWKNDINVKNKTLILSINSDTLQVRFNDKIKPSVKKTVDIEEIFPIRDFIEDFHTENR